MSEQYKPYFTHEELRDWVMADQIRRNPAFIPSGALGPAAYEALRERTQFQAAFPDRNGATGDPEDHRKEEARTVLDRIVQQTLFAEALHQIAAASTPVTQPGPYAVATKDHPVAVKGPEGGISYIDDGLSCKNPFNTTAAVPVPGPVPTFKVGPKERRDMSFAEASAPTIEGYDQIGPVSALRPTDLHGSFSVYAPPKTFADALGTDNPIVVPRLTPRSGPIDTNVQLKKYPIIEVSGPTLDWH